MREGDEAERVYLIYQGEFEVRKLIHVSPREREFDVEGYMHADVEERNVQRRFNQNEHMEKTKKKKQGRDVNTTVS